MDDIATVGYFVVILPEENEYQGFYVPRRTQKQDEAFLDAVRSEVGRGYLEPSAVIEAFPTANPEDQSLVGAVSAFLLECARTGDFGRLGPAASALRRLIGSSYFAIIGRSTKSGVTTTLRHLPPQQVEVHGVPLSLPVASIEAARESISRIPEVISIHDHIMKTAPKRKN